ncbi:MAG: hypothetical protein LBU62_11485 [Bacteroidales bacterium]|nr:hypothetical protein [Bacteroidales bacterium]
MKKILNRAKIFLSLTLVLLCVACSDDGGGGGINDGGGNSVSTDGKGGSMARFSIAGDMLYTVSVSQLKQFNIADPADPKYTDLRDINIGNNIETIFPVDTVLYIGSQDGMYIYDIKDPRFPEKIGSVSHIRSCDPVVVEGNYAYITLNTNYSACGASPNNVLIIYDVHDQRKPVELKTISLSGPQGLGADGDLLFVCDKGLKIFDISHPEQKETIKQIGDLADVDGAEYIRAAYDVIPANGLLMMVANEGLFLFDYSNFSVSKNLTFLGKIEKQ